ncbi:piggyBac transposable element-derived protein 2-like [Melitaea cinxia]|uniref:piggyBac transposable element-derived protein 2-like n=1 Tax=Melitaea cinxia TaxID=113334 RepID=UPI001E272FF2|nr:piggyBac transposable element-derived protein 2-like [Melitaea cinxia]
MSYIYYIGSQRDLFTVLSEDEIISRLEESDIDLSDNDEKDDTAYTPRPEEDEGSSTSFSSSSDEEADSQSVVSLQSSIIGRGRRRGRSRTRPPGRRGRSSTRGCIHQTPTPISDGWNGQFEPLEIPFYQPSYKKVETESWTPENYFTQYIDDDILIKMVSATNQTNILRKRNSLGLTVKELKVFFGIQMVMSAINLPKISVFWSQKFGINVIKGAMTRNRYFNIRNSLKVVFDSDVSDEIKQKNKLWKVDPLFQSLLRGCHAQEKPIQLSIDEMIIPFSGLCGIRQYCPGKPNPVGLKVFMLATPQGIVLDMLPYQGDTTCPQLIREGYTLGEASILSLCETLMKGHHIYFDRYFTTVKLADILLQKGFYATGTIQRNKIPKNCHLSDEKVFAKMSKGFSETKCRNDKLVNIVRWLDNKSVILLSTIHSSEKQNLCRRWSKKKKIYEFVSRPEIVKSYNQ